MVFLRKEVETFSTDYPQNGMPWETLQSIAWYLGTAWQRIEAYTRTRYSEREVIWIIEGNEGDEWCPPLEPVVSKTALKWSDTAWVSASLADGPLGLVLPENGIFKVTAQVGAGTPPDAVMKAHHKLAWYLSSDPETAGNLSTQTGDTNDSGGGSTTQVSRLASHAAKAMQNSGAADLLRPYRRQKL